MFTTLSAIAASAAALVLVGSAGGMAEQELCFGATPTITGSGQINGTMGDDVILGSDEADEIFALAGNDKVCAGGGDDRIGGGPGSDELDGGPGNDDIDGGPGNDTLLGGDGDDTMRCGADTDVADGGAGVNVAETSGFAACESVTNASPPQAGPVVVERTVRAILTGTKRGARGRFDATVTETETGATLAWRLTFRGLTGTARAAHVHLGRPGQAGRVLVRLCAPCRSGMRGTSQVSGQPARMAIFQGNASVDIHTKRNPRGELRGRIVRVGG
jgi:hypothetical protein